ncbi:MAG: shikimate dehydrogenase [Belnapia sp.]|nr:shikimate dehydrogenase [Belnapia sp.]
MPITGAARVFAILGDPIHVVRSPGLWNAAFAKAGLDAVFVPFEVGGADIATVWAGLTRIRNLDGVVLTMPHKQAVVPLLDALGPMARLTGTVNTVRRQPGGGWEGDMFDGEGFVAGLLDQGHDPAGRRVLQLGCGGAGRAIAFALARAGAVALDLADVTEGRAAALAAEVAIAFPGCRTHAVPAGPAPPDPAGHELVVNATPLGLRPGDPLPLDPARLRPGQLVADVIPTPEITPLLDAARAKGCDVVSGRAMFEGQARLAAAFLGFPNRDFPQPGDGGPGSGSRPGPRGG